MAEALWNFRKQAHRDLFGKILAPLIVASRSRDFVDKTQANDQLVAWVMSLSDVPESLLEAGVERLMARGVTWMPRPGDLRAVCCDIVDERRAKASRLAQALEEQCALCSAMPGWVPIVVEGVERVTRCDCWHRGRELVTQAGQPLKRPALNEAETVT